MRIRRKGLFAKVCLGVCAITLAGCGAEAPPEESATGSEQPGDVAVSQAAESTGVMPQAPEAKPAAPVLEEQGDSSVEEVAAPSPAVETEADRLKAELMSKGWREKPAPDGGTLLLPPGLSDPE